MGREAITKYFTVVVNTGNKVEFVEKKLVAINPTTMMAVGFNDFMRNKDGKLTPEPARFTMVLVKQGNDGSLHIITRHCVHRPSSEACTLRSRSVSVDANNRPACRCSGKGGDGSTASN